MKNNKTDFLNNPSNNNKEGSENKKETFQRRPKAAQRTMTEQIIAPPPRVWEKIERILDQQDERRNQGNDIISSSFANQPLFNGRKTMCFAAAAGATLIAGFVLLIK